MYINTTDVETRWKLTKMMYGGQSDQYDFHKVSGYFVRFWCLPRLIQVGFDFALLGNSLRNVGFCQIERLQDFALNFQDCSNMHYKGHYISLNVAAKVCMKKDSDGRVIHDMLDIKYSGLPYKGSEVEAWK